MQQDVDSNSAAAASWSALGGAIAASQIGQMLLKAGATGLPPAESALGALLGQLLRWPTVVGLGFYGAGTLLYMVALRRIPMSVALPCTAVSFVAATAVGVFAFGEPFNERHVAGLALVCAGVVLLATTIPQAENGAPAAGAEPRLSAALQEAASGGIGGAFQE
jgi:multidrug transporter EmrE-like cation transporter